MNWLKSHYSLLIVVLFSVSVFSTPLCFATVVNDFCGNKIQIGKGSVVGQGAINHYCSSSRDMNPSTSASSSTGNGYNSLDAYWRNACYNPNAMNLVRIYTSHVNCTRYGVSADMANYYLQSGKDWSDLYNQMGSKTLQ